MRDDLPSRSTVAAVLVLPLLAIAVLSGLGAVANHQAGGRAERVRELVPFAAALTTLVHELQQERGLSDDHLGSRAGRSGPGPEALPAVREVVDGAVAAYRDAAVRL